MKAQINLIRRPLALSRPGFWLGFSARAAPPSFASDRSATEATWDASSPAVRHHLVRQQLTASSVPGHRQNFRNPHRWHPTEPLSP